MDRAQIVAQYTMSTRAQERDLRVNEHKVVRPRIILPVYVAERLREVANAEGASLSDIIYVATQEYCTRQGIPCPSRESLIRRQRYSMTQNLEMSLSDISRDELDLLSCRRSQMSFPVLKKFWKLKEVDRSVYSND